MTLRLFGRFVCASSSPSSASPWTPPSARGSSLVLASFHCWFYDPHCSSGPAAAAGGGGGGGGGGANAPVKTGEKRLRSERFLPKNSRAGIPYTADGMKLPEGSERPWMWWDFRDEQTIRLTKGHNCLVTASRCNQNELLATSISFFFRRTNRDQRNHSSNASGTLKMARPTGAFVVGALKRLRSPFGSNVFR